jgi:hypothetical protein
MPVNQTIEQFLGETQAALESAHNPALQDHLAAYGLDPEHLSEGMALHQQASDAYDAYLDEHYEQSDAVRRHKEAFASVRSQFMRHRKLLRVAFDDDTWAQSRLRLDQNAPEAQEDVLSWAENTYRTLLGDEDLQASAAGVNVGPEAIHSALADIEEVRALSIQRDEETSEAEQSTETRNAAVAALRGWMHDFWRIVDVALEPNPQLKEMLGRTAPSR